jgi:acylphosphatase
MKNGALIILTGNNQHDIPYRFIVMKIAYKYCVNGYVKILDDNNILIETVAEEESTNNFYAALSNKFTHLKTKIKYTNIIKEYTEFDFIPNN